MMMDLEARLTHRAQWEVTTNSGTPGDKWGQFEAVTSITTIFCYAYQDLQSKQFGGNNIVTNPGEWIVVLPKERTDINIGDKLKVIKTKSDLLILSHGRVVNRGVYIHHDDEIRCVYVVLSPL